MDFTVSVVTAPSEGLVVTKEVELIKLGLLYADKVEVSSAGMYYVLAFAKMATLVGKERIVFMRGLLPMMPGTKQAQIKQLDDLLSQYEFIKSKIHKNFQDIQIIQKLDEHIEDLFKSLEANAEKVFFESGIEPVIDFLKDGKVVLKDFGGNIQEGPQILFNNALDSLNNELAYPLFDSEVSELMNAYIKENDTSFKFDNTREMVVSKDLFLRLPNINSLRIEQVTALKAEMELEFLRFKSLISEYSNDIEGIPFESSVQVKLARKYNNEFKPQLLELQQAIDKNGFIRQLYDGVLSNAKEYSMLYVGAATIAAMKSAVIAAGGVAALHAIKAYSEKRKASETLKDNKLYFYHKLSQIR